MPGGGVSNRVRNRLEGRCLEADCNWDRESIMGVIRLNLSSLERSTRDWVEARAKGQAVSSFGLTSRGASERPA